MKKIEEFIKPYLYNDEAMVWADNSGGALSRNMRIFVVLSTASLLTMVVLAAAANWISLAPRIIILSICGGLALFTGLGLPYLLTSSMRKTFYVVTTRRIITFNTRELRSCELYKIGGVRLVQGRDGRGTIVISLALPNFSVNRKLNRAVAGTALFVFEDISDAEAVYNVLHFQINSRPDQTDAIFPSD